MTIVLDPKPKPQDVVAPAPPLDTAPDSVAGTEQTYNRQADEFDERQPLLPPAYQAPSSPSAVEAALSDKPQQGFFTRLRTALCAALLCVILLFCGLAIFASHRQRGDSSTSEDGDWAYPPTERGRASNPAPFQKATCHQYDGVKWPVPLYSCTTQCSLSLPKDNASFFLHASGPEAYGSLSFGPNPSLASSSSDDVVVEIEIVYASEEHFRNVVRIWEVKDFWRSGVEILTAPRPHPYRYSHDDHISFNVRILLPHKITAVPSTIWHYDSFEGLAQGFKLAVGDLARDYSFDSFIWGSHNSRIDIESLRGKSLSLDTTNAPISLSGSSVIPSIIAEHMKLQTTNGNLNLHEGSVKADKVELLSTNGAVTSSSTKDNFVATYLEIHTTNSPIEGHYTANKVSAETTNNHITATFEGISESIRLQTTNGALTTSLGFLNSSTASPIPASARTTNSRLNLSVFPSLPLPALALDAQTTSGKLELSVPNFIGKFSMQTSASQNTQFVLVDDAHKRRRVDVYRRTKGSVEGTVVDVEGLWPKGTINGVTTNANLLLMV